MGIGGESQWALDLSGMDWPSCVTPPVAAPGMPTLVVGWKSDSPWRSDSPSEAPSPTPFAQWVHQYGGHACLQAELLGVFVPLHLNESRMRDLSDHDSVFETLAGDGAGRFEGRRILEGVEKGLSQWWLHGYRDMGPDLLAVWDRVLARWLTLPPVAWGKEALLGFGVADLELLVGWTGLTFSWNPDRITATPFALTHSTLEELIGVGARRNLGPPELWLTWENSD